MHEPGADSLAAEALLERAEREGSTGCRALLDRTAEGGFPRVSSLPGDDFTVQDGVFREAGKGRWKLGK